MGGLWVRYEVKENGGVGVDFLRGKRKRKKEDVEVGWMYGGKRVLEGEKGG